MLVNNFSLLSHNFQHPVVMGILNVTPDSFYGNSRCVSEREIIDYVKQMISDGVDILDIGGCSTRPDSTTVSNEEEWNRLDNAMNIIRREFPTLLISIDTFRSGIVQALYDKYGAFIVNDISAGEDDCKMISTVAKLKLPYIAMHKRGTPQTMQQLTDYSNVVEEVKFYLENKITELRAQGIQKIVIDQGFGFAKTIEQNYDLFRHIKEFTTLGVPLLVGISRKRMIWELLNSSPEKVLNATSALHLQALLNGANIIRVHDVKEAKQMISIANLMI